MGGRLWLPTIILAALLLAACTASNSVPPSVANSASPANTVLPSPSVRPGNLSCDDAYTTEPRGAKPVFTKSGVGFDSLNKDGFDPISIEDAGLTGASGYFSKSPIYLDKGVAWAEVEVLTGDATLAWVPARVWTGPNGWPLRSYEASLSRFESCDGAYTGFLGGVVTPANRACIVVGVRSNTHPAIERIRIAIGRGACR